jgi:hypothetical protein
MVPKVQILTHKVVLGHGRVVRCCARGVVGHARLCDGSVIRDANFLKLTKPDDVDNFNAIPLALDNSMVLSSLVSLQDQ